MEYILCERGVSCVRENAIAGMEMHVGSDMELDGTARLRSRFLMIFLNRSLVIGIGKGREV